MARTSPGHSNSWMMCADAQCPIYRSKARGLPGRAFPTSFAKSSHTQYCRPLQPPRLATTNYEPKASPSHLTPRHATQPTQNKSDRMRSSCDDGLNIVRHASKRSSSGAEIVLSDEREATPLKKTGHQPRQRQDRGLVSFTKITGSIAERSVALRTHANHRRET